MVDIGLFHHRQELTSIGRETHSAVDPRIKCRTLGMTCPNPESTVTTSLSRDVVDIFEVMSVLHELGYPYSLTQTSRSKFKIIRRSGSDRLHVPRYLSRFVIRFFLFEIEFVANSDAFTREERKAVMMLSALYVVRMLGLFMVLIAIYATMAGATPFLLGLAVAHSPTQACLQIPMVGYPTLSIVAGW